MQDFRQRRAGREAHPGPEQRIRHIGGCAAEHVQARGEWRMAGQHQRGVQAPHGVGIGPIASERHGGIGHGASALRAVEAGVGQCCQ